MNIKQRLVDWTREMKIKWHWAAAKRAVEAKAAWKARAYARQQMAMAEINARSRDQIDRLERIDAQRLRKYRGQ